MRGKGVCDILIVLYLLTKVGRLVRGGGMAGVMCIGVIVVWMFVMRFLNSGLFKLDVVLSFVVLVKSRIVFV